MVVKAGSYFDLLFKWDRGGMQGDPLYPTIFNVIVDAVIFHWVKVVTPTEVGTGKLGLTIIYLEDYFYAEN